VLPNNTKISVSSVSLNDFPSPPDKPTVYVVGSEALPEGLLDVYPKWARRFGHRSMAFEPVTAPSEVDGAAYQRFVDFLRDEYHAVGAIMVTNASTLFEYTKDSFDEFDDDAELLGEIGVVVRTPGTLTALAPAKRAAQQAYEQIFGDGSNPPEALIIGATGSARALAIALSSSAKRHVCLTTLDGKSMTDMRQRITELPEDKRPTLRHIETQLEHDRLLTLLPPGSLVVNATGPADKDTPSPVGDAALFPQNGLVWDLDAVGISSPFLDKARQQRRPRGLRLADGPIFHQYQWFTAVAAVFGVTPTQDDAVKLRKLIS
jgi:shikimate dehydrogenase